MQDGSKDQNAWDTWLARAQLNPEKAIHESIIHAYGASEKSERLAQALILLHRRSMELANLDPLTGLLNRRSWLARWEQELTRANRHENTLGIVLVDLDGFKTINDRDGHTVGDGVLAEVAQTIQKSVRESDWVGRWGGDEFVIGLVDGNENAAQDLLRRLRVRMTPLAHRLDLPRFGLTGGWAIYPHDGLEAAKLIEIADHQLYQEKQPMQTAPQQKPAVLMVDDDLDLITVYGEILKAEGYPTFTAANWETAHNILVDNTIDIILLDLNLGIGQVDGWQALKELQENPNWKMIPVVLMTGQADREAIERAVLKGVMDYLTKPFTPDELQETIQQALII